MKNLTKVATIFGGAALLAAGCGVDNGAAQFSSATVSHAAAKDSPLTVSTTANQTTDKLTGYYQNCRTKTDGASFGMLFGGTNSGVNVVVGDTNCQLYISGIERKNPVTSSVIDVFSLVDPDDTSTTKAIQIKTAYAAANVAMAKRADGVQGALVNVIGTNLTFPATGFQVTLLSGASAASLTTVAVTGSSIGFSNVTAVTASEWAAPNYSAATGSTDTKIVVDIDNTIMTADGNFKLARATTSPITATEMTYGLPGSFIYDPAAPTVELQAGTPPSGATSGYFNLLDDAQKFQALRTAFKASAAYKPATTVLASAATLLMPAAQLFPLGTAVGGANAKNQNNIIVLQRKDATSGVASYQAFKVTFTY